MEIGELKQRITLQKPVTLINPNGFETVAWEDIKTVWAAAANLYGREFYAAAAVQAENTVTFTIRYLPGINTDMRIVFRGKHYNITAIDNVKYRNSYLVIKALEERADILAVNHPVHLPSNINKI